MQRKKSKERRTLFIESIYGLTIDGNFCLPDRDTLVLQYILNEVFNLSGRTITTFLSSQGAEQTEYGAPAKRREIIRGRPFALASRWDESPRVCSMRMPLDFELQIQKCNSPAH